ncbi:AAA family ATPase [Pseudoxanthomonas suwonensis]|uniref:AAA family ATPase n=1 Tax=Pseudoxanthomonas suwonensis TaxID=314722 RepID=UPI00048DC36B|nr:AAA family ATPase [Pseudoxanthomonas suwonensis]
MTASELLGREQELAVLEEAWKQALQGKPQIRVVVADSGYGKTRLVQALYSRLSTDYDPRDYWPPHLLADQNSLRVMPALESVTERADMPWFWWGVRWPDPAMHNASVSRGRLLESYADPAMRHHIDALRFHLERRASAQAAARSMGKAILGAIPVLGPLSTAVNAALDIVEAVNIGRDYRARIERGQDADRRYAEEAAQIVAVFATMLEKVGEDGGGLPVVLFLDDTQWMDPLTVRILGDLWNAATERKWRLLVVVTHWEREWLLRDKAEGQAEGFASWFLSRGGSSAELEVVPLPKLGQAEMAQLLDRELPGLTPEQREHFLRAASGNPRFVVELGLYLRGQPEMFVGGDVRGPLTDFGFQENRKPGLAIEELEAKRFDRASSEVRLALGLSSLQGDQFVREFTLDVAQKLPDERLPPQALAEAERPFVLAASLDDARMEFRSSTIYSKSEKYLRARVAQGSAVEMARAGTVKEWIAAGRMGRMRRDMMFAQVHAALATFLAAGAREDVLALLEFLVEQRELAGEFRDAKELAPRVLEFIGTSSSVSDFPQAGRMLGLCLRLLDGLLGTDHSAVALQYAPACQSLARALGDEAVQVFAARVHADALAAEGRYEDVVRLALESGLPSKRVGGIQAARLSLRAADALNALGRTEEALDIYEPLVDQLKQEDKKWGAYLHAAVVGWLCALLESGLDRWDEEYLQHAVGYARALTTARALAGVAVRDDTPAWLRACIRHDTGMLGVIKAVAAVGREQARGPLAETLRYFDDAMGFWDGADTRPELRARTVWARAAARLMTGAEMDGKASLDEALAVIEGFRGAGHPEVAVARTVRDACHTGLEEQAREHLLAQVLRHGWQRPDVDFMTLWEDRRAHVIRDL